MDAELVYGPGLRAYDFGGDHPLKPERFTLAAELMTAYGLVPGALALADPTPAAPDDLLRVHDAGYVEAVIEAGTGGGPFPRCGLGTADTPSYSGMHEAAALVAGASVRAAVDVAEGRVTRAFSIAGGLHHAHRDRAAGFCVYNDCAVAMARTLADHPEWRLLYVDIDAHHGDGVQDAFWNEPRVLTISLHETGYALYPGTGFQKERGGPDAPGAAANVPMPPMATDPCYRYAFDQAVVPLAELFGPDMVFAQCGADAHHADPLTSLGLTLPGHRWLVRRVVELADRLCGGRLVAFGGGGYAWEHIVPRAWTAVAAELAGVDLPEALPEDWRDRVRTLAGVEPPETLSLDRWNITPAGEQRLLAETIESVRRLMDEAQSSRQDA